METSYCCTSAFHKSSSYCYFTFVFHFLFARSNHWGLLLALNLANILALLLCTAATLCTVSGLSCIRLDNDDITIGDKDSLQTHLV